MSLAILPLGTPSVADGPPRRLRRLPSSETLVLANSTPLPAPLDLKCASSSRDVRAYLTGNSVLGALAVLKPIKLVHPWPTRRVARVPGGEGGGETGRASERQEPCLAVPTNCVFYIRSWSRDAS